MTTLTYTTLASLVAGTPEKVADVVDCFNKIQTVLNGNLDSSNYGANSVAYGQLAATVDQYYKDIERYVSNSGFLTAATYAFSEFASPGGTLVANSTTGVGVALFYLDPAEYPSGSRTAKLRIKARVVTNGTAPAVTYTYGLYPATATGGAGSPFATLGTVVAGSTAAIASPAAGSASHAEGSEFSFPSAGFYALGVVVSGTEAGGGAGSHHHRATLQFRAT